jgi:hypothetical protein
MFEARALKQCLDRIGDNAQQQDQEDLLNFRAVASFTRLRFARQNAICDARISRRFMKEACPFANRDSVAHGASPGFA